MEARYLSGSVAWGTATANILVAMGAACCVILIGIIAWVWWDSRFEKTEKDEESCQVEELQETQSYESGERKDDIEDRVEVMSTADWSYSVAPDAKVLASAGYDSVEVRSTLKIPAGLYDNESLSHL